MEDKNHETGVPCEEVEKKCEEFVKVVKQPKQDEDQNRAGAAAAASEDIENEFLSEPVPPVDQNGPCEHVCSLASSLGSSHRSSVLSQSSYTTDYEQNFYCFENEDFWTSIPGGSFERKKWGSFLQHLGDSFNEDNLATEPINNTTRKVLKRILQLEDSAEDSAEIKVEAFIRFVGWFGPMKAEKGKCIALREVNILHEGSTVETREGKRKSWFAGYLDRPKAEEYLINEEVGTYLVRFSDTERKSASFVLSIVVAQRCVEHFIIERTSLTDPPHVEPCFGVFRLGDIVKSFPNLVELIQHFELNEITSEYPGVTCDGICPNLPLNMIIAPYKRATRNAKR